MERPKEAIERMREFVESQEFYELCQSYRHARDPIALAGHPSAAEAFERLKAEIMAHLADSIPEGSVPVVWPKELTLERLEYYAKCIELWEEKIAIALRALAAIAPQRKKRVVNIWNDGRDLQIKAADWAPFNQSWRKVAGPIEIED